MRRDANVKHAVPFVGNAVWVTPLSDPDGYRIEFESPTDVPEETVYSGEERKRVRVIGRRTSDRRARVAGTTGSGRASTELERWRFVLVLLLIAAGCGHGMPAAEEQQAAFEREQGFTWVATADHFEEPVEGLIEHVVAAKPAFVVGIGDLVFQSRPQDFAVFEKVIIEPLAAVGAKFYPVVGNHDFPLDDRWSTFWPEPTNRLYYSFDYGNSHFAILDTNRAMLDEAGAEGEPYEEGSEFHAIQTQASDFEPGSAQYEWLSRDLEQTTKKHVFVLFHEPAFSYGGHESSPRIQAALCPLFERHRVTAALSGHSHGYERFVPLRVDMSSGSPVAVRDEQNGVVYVVAAGGWRNLYDITRHETHAAIAKEYHFLQVDVDGDVAKFTAVRAQDGRALDTFEVKSRRP